MRPAAELLDGPAQHLQHLPAVGACPRCSPRSLIAAVLDANIRAKTFWRMGVLLPYVVAPVAVGVIFSKMFADKSGLINSVLG